MKQKRLTTICAIVLALAMLMGTVPLTAVVALAADTKTTGQAAASQKKLTPAETVQKEMSERSAITKDRSQIKASSEAAIYHDGNLCAEGTFAEMWNSAVELAAYVKTDKNHSNNGKFGTIEFVLNKDWKGETGTLSISNKKITVDLNGHLLYTKKGAAVFCDHRR